MRADDALPQSESGDILVVEDTPASLRLLASLLAKAGYRVREAPDGELALWSAQAQPPDLILLDVRMPGMDGYEVCRQLRRSPALQDVPVIFLSAFNDTDDKLRGFEAGGVDYIAKPYDFLEVKARVAAQLQLRQLRRLLAYQNAHLQQLVEAKAQQLLRSELALAAEKQQRDAAERESRLRLAEIAHLNRNASATVLCASLIHELNQPLTAILSNAEAAELLLARPRPALGEIAEIVGDIRRDNLRASDLIQRMRTMLRKGEPVHAELDLARLVRQVAGLLAAEARKRRIRIEVQAPDTPLAVCGDAVQLEQVLVNLVLNAMDAMQDSPGAACIAIRAERLHGEVQVRVSDQGCGFDGEAPVGFASFASTKPQGMGLGLSISSAIVQAHGGRLMASNNPEGGATVGFLLPAGAPPGVLSA